MDIDKIINEVEVMHPYKKAGDRDSYSQYAEGWSDACDILGEHIKQYLSDGETSNEAKATLPINSVMPRLIIQGIEFNKPDKDNEAEIVVPSNGYDDDNHIWLTIDELKQIGEFYFNGA